MRNGHLSLSLSGEAVRARVRSVRECLKLHSEIGCVLKSRANAAVVNRECAASDKDGTAVGVAAVASRCRNELC